MFPCEDGDGTMTCEGYIVAARGDMNTKKGRKYRILWDGGTLFWVKYQRLSQR